MCVCVCVCVMEENKQEICSFIWDLQTPVCSDVCCSNLKAFEHIIYPNKQDVKFNGGSCFNLPVTKSDMKYTKSDYKVYNICVIL